MSKIRTNINLRIATPLAFASMLFFPSAIWMFFYTQYLSFAEIAAIMAMGAIFSIILEVPTGVFADIVGRKWAVFASYVLFAIAMVGVSTSTSYLWFLIWTLVNGMVNALYSGSMEALVYDTLKESGKEDEFDHWVSRMETATWIGLFVSTVIGGYLYTLDPRFPYFAQAVFMAMAALLSLLLKEPRLDSYQYSLVDGIKQNLVGFGELLANGKRRYLTIVFVTIGVGYYIASDILGISQAREYGLKPEIVGWVFGVGYIISAIASHYYPTLRKTIGEMRLIWLAAGVLIISFVMAKYVGAWIGTLLIIMRIASSTTFRNSRSVIVNREISSKNRATTLSTLNLLVMLPYALFANLIGSYMDQTSPNQFAWMLGMGLTGALGLIYVVRAASMRLRI